MNKEVNIYNENISLFDFDDFEISYINETKQWVFNTKEDDEFKRTIILEEGEISYFDDNKKLLEDFNFTLDSFNKIKKFYKGKTK